MKIIDRNTGKRVGSTETAEVNATRKKLKEEDPILRNADKDENLEEFSAMDPPDAYDSEKTLGVQKELFHPFIQNLIEEHKEVLSKVENFDKALIAFKTNGFNFTADIQEAFNEFFPYFDEHIIPHNEREERYFFRILHERLIESGEHGEGDDPKTSVDLMEDDHHKFLQLTALCFNLLGLGSRLRDEESRMITFDHGFQCGRELTELLRLHIFRENETLFPLAQRLFSEDDFKNIIR